MDHNPEWAEAPIRLHYDILDGRIRLPEPEAGEIVCCRRGLEALMRAVLATYVGLLAAGRTAAARAALETYRGLAEPRFDAVYARFGYPDEIAARWRERCAQDGMAAEAGTNGSQDAESRLYCGP